jgi:hypothetical protein
MARQSYVPSTVAGKYEWATNLSTRTTATPTAYGLTALQAAAFAAVYGDYATAYAAAAAPVTRTRAAVTQREQQQTLMLRAARSLVSVIEGYPELTDAQRVELGLTIRKRPSPVPVPDSSPRIDIVSREGTSVKIRLHDATGSRRGRPAGVDGAAVFSFVGNDSPVDITDWKFEGNTTKTEYTVYFAANLPPGTVVWFTAFWFNPRAESGPACAPVSAILAGGQLQMAA